MYKIIDERNIKRLSDNASIPNDEHNTDYQVYLSWIAEGNKPEPAFTKEELKTKAESEVKAARDALLASTDWALVEDSPLTVKQKAAYKSYRQELRDITKQKGYPTKIKWPVLDVL